MSVNPFDFERQQKHARHDAANAAREDSRKAAKVREENRRFAWHWAPESVQLAAGFDPMSPNPVVPLGWPPGKDPSQDIMELKEPSQIEPAAENVGNPWA